MEPRPGRARAALLTILAGVLVAAAIVAGLQILTHPGATSADDQRASGTAGADRPRARPARRRPAKPTFAPPRAKLVRHGPRDTRTVALTFDADMTEAMRAQIPDGSLDGAYDRRITRILRRTDTPATIFMTGLWARELPRQARRLARDPLFEIANHSLDHKSFKASCFGLPTVTDDAERRREVSESTQELEDATGRRPRWFRFPGGCHSKDDLALVAEEGQQAVGWDVVSGDPYLQDPQAVVRAVLDGVKPGSIIVMHLNGTPTAPATADALPAILRGLRKRDLRPVKLETMLRQRAGRRGA